MNIKPLLNELKQLREDVSFLRENVQYWKDLTKEYQQQYTDVREQLGTLGMIMHVSHPIDKQTWDDYKSLGQFYENKETGEMVFLVIPQGPKAKEKVYSK